MEILNPPKSYIDYRCYIHGLSGQELSSAQEKFYKKHSESKHEIIRFFNWMKDQRDIELLPIEQIEIRENDGKKHGKVLKMVIYDIDYWIEGGQLKQRKIYIPQEDSSSGPQIKWEPFKKEKPTKPNQMLTGPRAKEFEQKRIDFKSRSAGEREPGEEG